MYGKAKPGLYGQGRCKSKGKAVAIQGFKGAKQVANPNAKQVREQCGTRASVSRSSMSQAEANKQRLMQTNQARCLDRAQSNVTSTPVRKAKQEVTKSKFAANAAEVPEWEIYVQSHANYRRCKPRSVVFGNSQASMQPNSQRQSTLNP